MSSSLTERQQESVQRLAERLKAEREVPVDHFNTIERVTLGNRLLSSFLLAMASPASCLPIFAFVGLVFAVISRASGLSATWVVVALLLLFWLAAFLAVTAVANSWRQRRLTGYRRYWPALSTLSAVVLAGWELAAGGDLDVAVFLWVPVGLWWSFSMLLSLTNWRGLTVARWFVLPLCVALIGSARITDGFFSYRFDASVKELTAAATAEPNVSSGTYGSFEILLRRRVRGCAAAFKIDGWWVDDQRTIAYCPNGFSTSNEAFYDPHDLGHGWYEIGFFTE